MPVPVNIPGVPLLSKADADTAVLSRWFLEAQIAVNAIGTIRSYEVLDGPANAFAHTIPDYTGVTLITPAGGLATGTITLPAKVLDGFQQEIFSTQAVGALTVLANAGQIIIGPAVVALVAHVKIVFFWRAANNTWYRML